MVNEKVVTTVRLPGEFTCLFPRMKDERGSSLKVSQLCWLSWWKGTILRVTVLLYKYKANFSVMVLADADANYWFQVIDAGVAVARRVMLITLWICLWTDTQRLQHPLLFLQPKCWGPSINDETVHLRVNLMLPYSRQCLPRPTHIFKYWLSRVSPPFWHLNRVLCLHLSKMHVCMKVTCHL